MDDFSAVATKQPAQEFEHKLLYTLWLHILAHLVDL